MKTYNTGDKLQNGATVIQFNEQKRIVLAKSCHKDEYVTWHVAPDGECYWGHYLDTLEAATENYKARLGRI